MPDLVTHFTSAYILKIPRRWSQFCVAFYIGVFLPDLLSRPLLILLPQWDRGIISVHTPAVTAVFCLLIAQFFDENIRSGVRTNLLLGAMLHFCLDFLQIQIIESYFWFFPFSWKTFDFGLIGPEESLKLVPFWIALVILIEVVFHLNKK